MDILSDYRVSSHWANSHEDLDRVAEQVRRAYEQRDERATAESSRRTPRLGFLRRFRHA